MSVSIIRRCFCSQIPSVSKLVHLTHPKESIVQPVVHKSKALVVIKTESDTDPHVDNNDEHNDDYMLPFVMTDW